MTSAEHGRTPDAPDATGPQGPTLADIIGMNDLFHDTALLHLAVSTRLFDRLVEPATAAKVAGDMGWVERKAGILLDALAAVGLLAKQPGADGDLYRNAPNTTTFLTTGSDAYVGAIIDHQRLQWDLWGRIGEVLGSHDPAPAQQELRLRKDEAANAAFHRAMVQLSRDNVRHLLDVDDFAGVGRVLDLCGGHGSYVAALARKHPGLTGEVWDMATARELALATFAAHGVEGRVGFRAQDVTEAAAFAGVEADACMLNDCLHYFDEDETRALIGRVAGVVPAGGLLVVMTMTLEADRVSPPSAAGFSLHMMLNTNHGGLHPTPWIEGVMDEAGFAVERRPLGSLGRYSLLIGRKR